MKKSRILIVLILVLVSLQVTGCGKYNSHFSAMMCVHTNTSSSASLSFSTFDGVEADTMKCKEEPGNLEYSAKLEKGSATVYVDYDGTKKELFSINGDEEVSSTLTGLEEGTVYVIIETSGKCENGSFDFEMK